MTTNGRVTRIQLRDTTKRAGSDESIAELLAPGLRITGAEPVLTLYGRAPEFRFTEIEQVDPAGHWRARVASDVWTLQRSLTRAPNWGTTANSLTGTWLTFNPGSAQASSFIGASSTGLVRLDSDATAAGGSANIRGVRLQLYAASHASTPGRFDIATRNTDSTDELVRFIIPGGTTATVSQFLNGQVTFTTATTGVASATSTVDITGVTAGTAPLRVLNTNNAALVQALRLEGDRSAPAANDGAYASLLLSDSAGNQDEFIRLTWRATTVTDGATQAGDFFVSVLANNALAEAIRFGSSGAAATVGFFGTAAAGVQTSGANLTNNVTAGGTDTTIADFTDLVTYSNDAAAIRNDLYQLSRKLKQVNDALRLYGLLT